MNKDQMYYAKKYRRQGAKQRMWPSYWYDQELKRFIRLSRDRRSSYIKKHCNHQLRRAKLDYMSQRGKYRRYTNFWNELY